MEFIKMQGAGNDYLFFDCRGQTVKEPSRLAVRLSDRHFGVGADGIVLLERSAACLCRMTMFNADGSAGRMCGNALRCTARYLFERGELSAGRFAPVETGAGVRLVRVHARKKQFLSATADMGVPVLSPPEIPCLLPSSRAVEYPLRAGAEDYFITAVSMGNPHAVIFCPNAAAAPVETAGPLLERHPAFPDRTNVEFVSVRGDGSLAVRVYERGSGETLACGTGACASLVAARLAGKLHTDRAAVHMRGGTLSVRWDRSTDHVFLTGPAAAVFQGRVIESLCPVA